MKGVRCKGGMEEGESGRWVVLVGGLEGGEGEVRKWTGTLLREKKKE